MPRLSFHTVAALLVGWLMNVLAFAAEPPRPSAEELRRFEMKVRPLLAENCFKCHGPNKQQGELRLDSLTAMLSGGESGAAIVPGNADESLLIEAVNYQSLEMPPSGKLSDEKIAVLRQWVETGAPWPSAERGGSAPQELADRLTRQDREFWSFRPVRRPAVPRIDDDHWSRNEIDRFIVRRLRLEGLAPTAEADRLALVRRVYFDLIGLPPSPAEIDAFDSDRSPTAYENLIDRLLDDPRYGERWTRHWLDLVRYAESDGYKQDAYRPHAWRYRDYVIRSFNDDKPYDRFVMEQLAGDEIAPYDPDAVVATGFLRHWIYEYNQRDVRTQWDSIINDVTDVTGEVFLGLGMGCARCHDHKFDPIFQEDYYRLRAFFAPLLPTDDAPAAMPERRNQYQEQLAVWERKTSEIRRQIEQIERPLIEPAINAAIDKFPPDIRDILRKPADQRSPLGKQLAAMAGRQLAVERDKVKVAGKLKGQPKEQWESLQKQLTQFDDERPKPLPVAYSVVDIGRVAPRTVIPGSRQTEIQPGFLTVLDDSPVAIMPPSTLANSTGRRTALAFWITRSDNPLSTRVIVNRVWQYHFGRGLVETSSDFGHLGRPPTHPELLDFLADRFVAERWSIKNLHRLIMTSATYRQSALRSTSPQAQLKDPDNRLLWRMNTRRLDAEQIRDAMLAATGELDATMGGPSVDRDQPRRTVYIKAIRNVRDPLLAAFDAPDTFTSVADRNVTTTPTQALLLINGQWTLARATVLAERLEQAKPADDRQLADQAYRWVLGRHATAAEQASAAAFLQDQTAFAGSADSPKTQTPAAARRAAVIDFCHVLLNSSEFLYVD